MSGPKHTPAWERVVTLDDHDALKRELADDRTLVGLMAETMDAQQDIIKRLAEALKEIAEGAPTIMPASLVKREHYRLAKIARAALREAGVEP